MTRSFVRKVRTFSFIALLFAGLTNVLCPPVWAQRRSDVVPEAVESAQSAPVSSPFLPAVLYGTGGNFAHDEAMVDLNGDGKLDVIVADYSGETIGVLLGNGDGTFQNARITQLTWNPVSIAALDVNRDGKPDLIITACCESNGDGEVAVLLGNGDGTFQNAVFYDSGAGGGGPFGVADVNGDGIPDIAVANWTNSVNKVGLLLGNGDGTFKTALTSNSPSDPGCLTIADVNGDGKADLLICSEDSVVVLLGNGNGFFQPGVNYSAGYCENSVAVGDLNGDGFPDLLVGNEGQDGCAAQGFVGVLLGVGDGTFQPEVNYYSGSDGVGRIILSDVNLDGKIDAVSSSDDSYVGVVGILLGNGDGTFQTPTSFSSGGPFPVGLAVGDLNGDGKPDIVAANFFPASVAVLLNNGGGHGDPSATVLSSSLNPSLYGQTVKFTASVSAESGSPTGNITFYDFGIALANATLVNGSASFSTSSLGSRTHWMTALYQGSNQIGASVSTVLYQVVKGTATTTSVASSLNPSLLGQSVTFTALVTSASGTPTGVVYFLDGGSLLGIVNLTNGTASISTSSLGAGSHSMSAVYQGSDQFTPSTSATLIQVVNGTATATTTTLTSSKNPSVYQTPVTFTAVVSATSGTPTGTVTFFDGSSALGNGTLAGGTASFTTSALVRGPHSITASYLGAGNFAPSVSTVLNQVVNLGGLFNTQTKLNHPGPSFVGQPVTFIATVTSKGGAIPDGDTVTFSDESLGNLGTGITHSGVATFTTSTLSPRSHIIGALYNGDANFNTSFTKITQVVNKYPTTTVLKSSLNPASYGQSVTFTATVTSSGPTPTGTVRFTGIGSATLVGGVATFTKPQLRAGTYAITADYVGDGDSATSKSSLLQEVVNPASTTTTITSSVNPSSAGQTVTFTATVSSSTGIDPFGKVTFTAGATTLGTVALKNKVASISTSTLPTGSTKITATYGGAAGFTGSAVSLTQKVNP